MKVLLIGNGYLEGKHDLSKFDAVCVFDDIAHREYFDKANYHFMRSDRDGHWLGMGLVGLDGYKARPVLYNGKSCGFTEHVCQEHKALIMGVQGNFSSLFAAVFFFDNADEIHIDGFTFDTFGGIDWKYETEFINNLANREHNVICYSSGIVVPDRRLAHFVWIDGDKDGIEKDLTFGQFVSVYSFMIHHPKWRVTLWSNANFHGELFQRCRDRGLILARFLLPAFSFTPTTHKGATYSDFLRYYALSQMSGLYCDICDTVTIGNFDDIYDKCHTLGYSKVPGDSSAMSSGWLCVNRRNDPTAKKIVDWFDNSFVDGWGKHQMALDKDDLPEPLNSQIMFPYSFEEMRNHKKNKTPLPEIPIPCRQIHFYNASGFQHHPWSFSEEYATMNLDNVKDHQSPIAKAFRLSLKCAGDGLLDADNAKVFGRIYEKGWNNGNGSGAGSLPENCKGYIEWLPFFLKKIGCKGIIDFGCGDWQFSRFIDWKGIAYIGVDCVKEVIEKNRQSYMMPNVLFDVATGVDAKDGWADCVLLKEVAIHWSNAEIVKFFNDMKGKTKYILVCNSVGFDTNNDIETGGFRSFDPSADPFNFPCREVFSWKPQNQASFGTNKTVIMKCWLVDMEEFSREQETPKRKAHFLWFEPEDGNSHDIKPREWFSLKSFVNHHKHWNIYLWTNCNLGGPLLEDAVKDMPQGSFRINRTSIHQCPKNQVNISACVDWFKLDAIYHHGGMICGLSDTITLGCFDTIYDRSEVLSWSHYIRDSKCVVANGWFCCSKPKNIILKTIMDEAATHGHVFGWYEKRMAEIVWKNHPSAHRDPIAPTVVFGIYADESPKLWEPNHVLKIPPECLQYHLYAGNVIPSAANRRKSLDESSKVHEWETANTVSCRLMRESMKGVRK